MSWKSLRQERVSNNSSKIFGKYVSKIKIARLKTSLVQEEAMTEVTEDVEANNSDVKPWEIIADNKS